MKKIQKRDGRIVDFDEKKIAAAITKAFDASFQSGQGETAEKLAAEVTSILEVEGLPLPGVEHVQDLVERVLMDNGFTHTAKAYILYRNERTRARNFSSRLMKTYEDITYLSAGNVGMKRENAKINGGTAMGNLLQYGSEGAKVYYETYVLKPEFTHAHDSGDIHIHHLNFYTSTTTSTQIDMLQLFHGGFSAGLGELSEPDDVSSYSALACIAIQSNQNDQHGSQSIANFDYGMAAGVRRTFLKKYRENLARAIALKQGTDNIDAEIYSLVADTVKESGLSPSLKNCGAYLLAERPKLMERYALSEEAACKYQEFAHTRAIKETDEDTYRAMKSLVRNLNTIPSWAGAQVPFSSVNYGMDTSPEGRMAVKNLLLASKAGLNGKAPAFPVQIFRVKEGVNYNPKDPNYDLFQLACQCSANCHSLNFSFLDAPFNAQYYKRGRSETEVAYTSHCTRVIDNVYDPSRQICSRRGILSITSINLPRLGIEARGDLSKFYQSLDNLLKLCVEQLLERFEIQCQRRAGNFPFLMGQGVWLDSEKLKPDDEVREVLKHGTLSVGFIGLAETLVALTGKHHAQSEESQKLGLDIIGHMRQYLDQESQKRHLNFTLLAVSDKKISSRLFKLDQKRYGILPGITDRESYTSGFQIPPRFFISASRKIQLEAPYHALTNAGHMTAVEIDGNSSQASEAFEEIIRCMKESGIGYGSVSLAST